MQERGKGASVRALHAKAFPRDGPFGGELGVHPPGKHAAGEPFESGARGRNRVPAYVPRHPRRRPPTIDGDAIASPAGGALHRGFSRKPLFELNEMIGDPDYKIGRPRQLYSGAVSRDVVPIEQR
jgi:hypothetical protein